MKITKKELWKKNSMTSICNCIYTAICRERSATYEDLNLASNEELNGYLEALIKAEKITKKQNCNKLITNIDEYYSLDNIKNIDYNKRIKLINNYILPILQIIIPTITTIITSMK